jgi:uncharacterized membrane protein
MISNKIQMILYLIAAIAWFIAGGLLITTYLPIGITFIIFGITFLALFTMPYKKSKGSETSN